MNASSNTPAASALQMPSYTLEELLDLIALTEGPLERALDPEKLEGTSPWLLGQFLDRLQDDQQRELLGLLDYARAAAVLAEVPSAAAAGILQKLSRDRALKILELFAPDDATDLVGHLGEEEREFFLKQLPARFSRTVEKLLEYPEDTAGGVMTPDIVTVQPEMTVDGAIRHIRRQLGKAEAFFYLYVTDARRRLLGVVSMRSMILAKPEERIETIMTPDLKGACSPEEDRETVARRMAEYNLLALPIVDGEGRLLGAVTHDDVVDIIRTEATEDMQKALGAGGNEHIGDNVGASFGKRIPWLLFNLVTAALAAAVVYHFQDAIASFSLLAVFMPVVASLGGNTGSQTLAVTLRALALGETSPQEAATVCLREMMKGLLNGLVVGAAAGSAVLFFTGEARVGAAVFLAMMANMALAGFAGAFIPLAMERLGIDPARSSCIFLTALTDMSGFMIFLSLAERLLGK